jgi:hypothetical protein
MTPTPEFLHYELAVERARRVSAERVVIAELNHSERTRELARAHEMGWIEPEREGLRAIRPHETNDFVDDE